MPFDNAVLTVTSVPVIRAPISSEMSRIYLSIPTKVVFYFNPLTNFVYKYLVCWDSPTCSLIVGLYREVNPKEQQKTRAKFCRSFMSATDPTSLSCLFISYLFQMLYSFSLETNSAA